jgi:hypothetical protein
MFELFSDIYFVLYKLYYVDQNDNLDIRVSLKNRDRGSITISTTVSGAYFWQGTIGVLGSLHAVYRMTHAL